MRKVTLTFGLLAGVIVSVLSVVVFTLCENGAINFDSGDFITYGSMVIALAMVFFGIKSYRDNYQNGVIKFTKGLQVGTLISLVASLLYVGTWEAFCRIQPEVFASFMDKYADHQVNKMRGKDASSAEIDEKIKEMANLKAMYQNPLSRIGITLFLILPVGIIITVISAAVLKRREFLPA
jgi:hypothetical protein